MNYCSNCTYILIMYNFIFTTGKGIPNQIMMSNNQIAPLNASVVPTTEMAVRQYNSMGGNLTISSSFGTDPLSSDENLVCLRKKHMQANIPNFDIIFHELVNGNDKHFRDGLKLFVELTEDLAKKIPSSHSN